MKQADYEDLRAKVTKFEKLEDAIYRLKSLSNEQYISIFTQQFVEDFSMTSVSPSALLGALRNFLKAEIEKRKAELEEL